jgi:hypothetical protein
LVAVENLSGDLGWGKFSGSLVIKRRLADLAEQAGFKEPAEK